MNAIVHIPQILEKILFDAMDSMQAAGTCRAMRDAWRKPPIAKPSHFARALVDRWQCRRSTTHPLIRVCMFPMREPAAWLRATGAPRPPGNIDAEEAIGEIASDILELTDGDGVTLDSRQLEKALQIAASLGRGGVVTTIIAWQKHRRVPKVDRMQCWGTNSMLMTLVYGIKSGSPCTVYRLLWDIVDAAQHPGRSSDVVIPYAAAADAGYDNSDNDDINGMMAFDPPPLDVFGVMLSTIADVYGLDDCVRTVLDACVVALLTASVNGYSDMLSRIVKFIKAHFAFHVVEMILLLAGRCSMEQPVDNLIRGMVEGNVLGVDSAMVMQALARASLPCLKYILSLQAASGINIPPVLLNRTAMRYARHNDPGRLEVLMAFWERHREIGGRSDTARAAISMVRRMAVTNTNTHLDCIMRVLSPHIDRHEMDTRSNKRARA